ncbi:hypothetical protein [Ferrimonas sp. YFM]|uniref:hypothetical protein n=1 Tax=Ferrimonas sp. YFM TaxID=3028878 RepID=UPI0025727173|nr:hypothetical protein [Ferrimonas sp. YFM]BDY05365.1 hypothetical protein F0521_24060 [Ferrimonas sp. YFM]
MSRAKSRGDAHPITQLLSAVTLALVVLFFVGAADSIVNDGVLSRFAQQLGWTAERAQ